MKSDFNLKMFFIYHLNCIQDSPSFQNHRNYIHVQEHWRVSNFRKDTPRKNFIVKQALRIVIITLMELKIANFEMIIN